MKTEKTARRFHVTKSVETANGHETYSVATLTDRQSAVALIMKRAYVRGTDYYVNGRLIHQDEN